MWIVEIRDIQKEYPIQMLISSRTEAIAITWVT